MHHACERRIIIRTGLDIHGCLLNQSSFGQMLQDVRTSSVGIQFDRIPEGMYFADKIFQIRSKVGSPPEIQTPSRIPRRFSGKRVLLLPGSLVHLPDAVQENCSGRTDSGSCSFPERS